MPYATNSDLPPPVRHVLPRHAQDIYREAFNHAFAAHATDPGRSAEHGHPLSSLLPRDTTSLYRKACFPSSFTVLAWSPLIPCSSTKLTRVPGSRSSKLPATTLLRWK